MKSKLILLIGLIFAFHVYADKEINTTRYFSGVLQQYATVSAMKSDIKLLSGMMVHTQGYSTAGDGGDAKYLIMAGSYTDDGGGYIQLNNGLWALLIPDGNYLRPQQWGAIEYAGTDTYNSGMDRTDEIQACFDYAGDNGLNINFKSGYYYFHEIELNNFIYKVQGGGVNNTFFLYNGAGADSSYMFKDNDPTVTYSTISLGFSGFRIEGMHNNVVSTPAWYGFWLASTAQYDYGVNFDNIYIQSFLKSHFKVYTDYGGISRGSVNWVMTNMRFGPVNEWCIDAGSQGSLKISGGTIDFIARGNETDFGDYCSALNGISGPYTETNRRHGYGFIKIYDYNASQGAWEFSDMRIEGSMALVPYTAPNGNSSKGVFAYEAMAGSKNSGITLSFSNIQWGINTDVYRLRMTGVANCGFVGINNDSPGRGIEFVPINYGGQTGRDEWGHMQNKQNFQVFQNGETYEAGGAYVTGQTGIYLANTQIYHGSEIAPTRKYAKFGDIWLKKSGYGVTLDNDGTLGWICIYPEYGWGEFRQTPFSTNPETPNMPTGTVSITSGSPYVTIPLDIGLTDSLLASGQSWTAKYSDNSYQTNVLVTYSGRTATFEDNWTQTDASSYIFRTQCRWVPFGKIYNYATSGTTANRPSASDVETGDTYFDTTLGKMIVSNGSSWINMDGTSL